MGTDIIPSHTFTILMPNLKRQPNFNLNVKTKDWASNSTVKPRWPKRPCIPKTCPPCWQNEYSGPLWRTITRAQIQGQKHKKALCFPSGRKKQQQVTLMRNDWNILTNLKYNTSKMLMYSVSLRGAGANVCVMHSAAGLQGTHCSSHLLKHILLWKLTFRKKLHLADLLKLYNNRAPHICINILCVFVSFKQIRCLNLAEEETLYLIQIVKELKDGEDAGADEESHLTPNITWSNRYRRWDGTLVQNRSHPRVQIQALKHTLKKNKIVTAWKATQWNRKHGSWMWLKFHARLKRQFCVFWDQNTYYKEKNESCACFTVTLDKKNPPKQTTSAMQLSAHYLFPTNHSTVIFLPRRPANSYAFFCSMVS